MLVRVDSVGGLRRTFDVRGASDARRAVRHLYARDLELWPYPPLYGSGVRYRREKPGRVEDWADAVRIQRRGHGDCEDLACARAAELVLSGADREAEPFVYRARPGLLHVVVARGDGAPEDPSAVLGMRARMNKIKARFRPRQSGIITADLSVPIGCAGLRVCASCDGVSRADALAGALDSLEESLAEQGVYEELLETGWEPENPETGFIPIVVAAGAAIAAAWPYIKQAWNALFGTTPYDAFRDFSKAVAIKDAGIDLSTIDQNDTTKVISACLASGIVPVYCSDSVGTRDSFLAQFSRRGWTGKAWWQAYGGEFAKRHWYGAIFRVADASQELRDKAQRAADAESDPVARMKRTLKICVDPKHLMRTYGGPLDGDAAAWDTTVLDAIPVLPSEARAEAAPLAAPWTAPPDQAARLGPKMASRAPQGPAMQNGGPPRKREAFVPAEPPMLAPQVANRLIVLRQLTEAARAGQLSALDRISQRNSPVGRMIAALLAGEHG